MNLKEFVSSCSSPEVRHVDAARNEFASRQKASRKLADRVRSLVIWEIEKQPNLERRDDHFYSLDQKGERFLAFITPISLKKFDRLAQKLDNHLKRGPQLAEESWWWHAWDLARFRIVTANLSDLVNLRSALANIIHQSSEPDRLYLRDSLKDYIWTDPNERSNASKSIHFRVCNSRAEIIEIQLMTLLQYSWDQIQHWLYEFQRSANSPLSGLDSNVNRSYWALSNSLFVLDEYIVSLNNSDPRGLAFDLPFDLQQHILTRTE